MLKYNFICPKHGVQRKDKRDKVIKTKTDGNCLKAVGYIERWWGRSPEYCNKRLLVELDVSQPKPRKAKPVGKPRGRKGTPVRKVLARRKKGPKKAVRRKTRRP